MSSITKVTKQRTQELKECDLPQGHFNEASKYLRGANQPSLRVLGACNTHQENIKHSAKTCRQQNDHQDLLKLATASFSQYTLTPIVYSNCGLTLAVSH